MNAIDTFPNPLSIAFVIALVLFLFWWAMRPSKKRTLKFRNFLTNNHATQETEAIQDNSQIRKTQDNNQRRQARVHASLHESLHAKETENTTITTRKAREET